MADQTIRGLDELLKVMDTLPVKIERNVARGMLRAGMAVVKPEAQRLVHSVSGKLAAGLKIATRARGGTVTARLIASGEHRTVAHLVEYGTKPHTITAKYMKALSFGGLFFQTIDHPGAAPKSFMRRALDTQARAATMAAAEYSRNRLATKEGLDVSSVKFEGDE